MLFLTFTNLRKSIDFFILSTQTPFLKQYFGDREYISTQVQLDLRSDWKYHTELIRKNGNRNSLLYKRVLMDCLLGLSERLVHLQSYNMLTKKNIDRVKYILI